MTEDHYTLDALKALTPQHDTFLGVDSDGCVFDTMEIKQKHCFHGLIAEHWGLKSIEPLLRETAEFVNLYSAWRGQNRFIALRKTFDLLRERPEAHVPGVTLPLMSDMAAFIDSGATLGNADLEREAKRTGSAELAHLYDWSLKINEEIAAKVKRIPPFPWALKSLQLVQDTSDVVCVSQTPVEALIREWKENNLLPYARFIAGQEIGTKAEHLEIATTGKYAPDRVLMIGDAPGDYKAAQANGVLFYPVNPSEEDASWQRFHDEAYQRFLDGTYAGDYAEELRLDFFARLPETPPWAS